MSKLKKDLEKFLANQEFEIRPEWLDCVELDEEQEQYLKDIEDQRLAELSEALARKTRLKELIEQPLKAQNFHLFFQYFKEWQNLDSKQICNTLSIEPKHLNLLIEVKNDIVQIPTQVMAKLIKFMGLSLSDAVILIENSFKLAAIKPAYGQHLSRSHDKDAESKSSSVNRAMNELLLKSKRSKAVDTSIVEDYLTALKQEFEQ